MIVEEPKHYHVSIASSAVADIKNIRQYILDTFRYEAYAKDFSRKIADAIEKMNIFPLAYPKSGFVLEGYDIHFRPWKSYLIFFIVREDEVQIIRVLKDRMYWQAVLRRMTREDENKT